MALLSNQLIKPSPAQELYALYSTLEPEDQAAFRGLLVQEAKTKAKAKTGKNEGVGDMVKELILDGWSNKEILVQVHEHYGNTNTTYGCVAWYRNDMKSKGLI